MSDDAPIPNQLAEKFAQAENWQGNTAQENKCMAVTIDKAPQAEIVNAKNHKIAEKMTNLINTKDEKDSLAANPEASEFSWLEKEKTHASPNKIVLSFKQTVEDVATLRQTILAAFDQEADIEVDASAVMTIDTATLQLLLACRQTVDKKLVIKSPSERFIHAAELLGMKKLLNL